MENISEFPSQQAEELQKQLADLDTHGKLKEEFLNRYQGNMGKPNSLSNYIDKHWSENNKKLFIEWTGIETFDDKQTIKRVGVKLNEITYGSKRSMLWKCSTCENEYIASPNDRTNKGSKCPRCKINKSTEIHKELGEKLDKWCNRQGNYGEKIRKEYLGILKNGDIVPIEKMNRGSREVVKWKCSICDYIWEAKPNDRTSPERQGCPYCSKYTFIKGKNDLETFCKEQSEFSKLLTEFMGEDSKGNKVDTCNIAKNSGIKVKWKCLTCGYIWYAKVYSRIRNGTGCPKCAGNICIKGINDLETYCKDKEDLKYILDEFIGLTDDNKHIEIYDVAYASIKKIQWRCNKCHKIWIASPNSRTNNKSGCPYCSIASTSFPEQYIYHSMKQVFNKVLNRAKTKDTQYEYDIVIPELKLCMEYSGMYWHKDKLDRDKIKEAYCKSKGINFLQIYVHNGELLEQDIYTKEKIVYQTESNKSRHIKQLQHIIEFILEMYGYSDLYNKIDFKLAEKQANEIMGKS